MIELALIDGDIVAYRCAAAYENQDENLARWQTSEMMRRILHETNALDFKCFLSGGRNYRYDIYPEYKANRIDTPKPKHLEALREHLVTDWKALVTDGIEADDALGIEQCKRDGDSVIVSIDKDLLMIPGHHYSFEISGTTAKGDVWTRAAAWRNVSPLMGLRHFYYQLIMGDRADNVFGYDGKARQKVPQFLEPAVAFLEECTTEKDMYEHVSSLYDSEERLHTNGKVLWIQREDGKIWEPPIDKESLDGSTP